VSIDHFYQKTFDPVSYNCWHFARDVWLHLTGLQLPDFTPVGSSWADRTRAALDAAQTFSELEEPRSPCIVLMRMPRVGPHVGVFYRERVLHIFEAGVYFQPLDLATRGWRSVQFYVPCPSKL
jgi:hypothetical protein